MLGYDADLSRTRLVVNESEAEQVREIFGIFLRHRALIPALEEIQERGFRLKSWTTRKGEPHAGGAFDRHSLVRLLSNVVYLGQVKYQGKAYPGEQPAIVDPKVCKRANALLQVMVNAIGNNAGLGRFWAPCQRRRGCPLDSADRLWPFG